MKKVSKSEAETQIKEFFNNIKNKSPKEVRKIQKLAMRHNIPLRELRKNFCKKCFAPYKSPKIRIKNKIKLITCENCGQISKWKLK